VQEVDSSEVAAKKSASKKRRQLEPVMACMSSKCELKSTIFVECDNCRMNFH